VGLWTLQLDSPAVAVHLADGASLKLHAVSATPDNASTVVVGTLQGSMYALPVAADWLQSTLPAVSGPEAIEYQTTAEAAAPASYESSHDTYISKDAPSKAAKLQSSGSAAHWQHSQQPWQQQLDRKLSQLAPDSSGRQTGQTKSAPRQPKPSAVDTDEADANGHPVGEGGSARKADAGSKALMPLPVKPAEGPEAQWQCPVSLHNVITSTAPQTFLPNLTDFGFDVEQEPKAAEHALWAGVTLGLVCHDLRFPFKHERFLMQLCMPSSILLCVFATHLEHLRLQLDSEGGSCCILKGHH